MAVILATSIVCAADIKVETVLTGLHNPCGIALRPSGTADKYEFYIADSAAGRVIKWSNHEREKTTDVITAFSAAPDRDLSHQTGPLGLLFLDPGLLVVGGTSQSGDVMLRLYELPEDGKILSANEANSNHDPTLPLTTSESEHVACSSMTRTRANDTIPDALIMAVRSADRHSTLFKARVQAGIVGPPQPYSSIALSNRTGVPAAVATSNTGRIVVAYERRLTFLNPLDGSVELELPTDWSSIIGLAYSPVTGNLYAADFHDGGEGGGIFRIDDASEPGRPACRTTLIAGVYRPTSLAFSPEGALYVTTFGEPPVSNGDHVVKNDSSIGKAADGTLQVITGDL